MIRLSHDFDEAAFVEAHRAMWRRRRMSPRNRRIGWALLAALPLSAWLAVAKGMTFTFLAAVAANALHWVFDWPLTRAIVRRRYAQMPSAGRRISWEIGEERLRVRSSSGESGEFGWDVLTDAWESPGGFVLVQPHNVTHFLPRSAFGSEADVEALRRLIARHVRPKAG